MGTSSMRISPCLPLGLIAALLVVVVVDFALGLPMEASGSARRISTSMGWSKVFFCLLLEKTRLLFLLSL